MRVFARTAVRTGFIAIPFLAAMVLGVATSKGEVTIDLPDPKAHVEIRVDGEIIDIKGLAQPLRLRVGQSTESNAPFTPSARSVCYVKPSPGGKQDGSSWQNAFSDLQDALQNAEGAGEIWVAAGTYRPTKPGGNRLASFRLPSGVQVFGGFQGNELRREDRKPARFVTTLSGDLNGDDTALTVMNEDNSYHVVSAIGCNAQTLLDGFTIVGGNANGSAANGELPTCEDGGGVLVLDSQLTLRNCVIKENSAKNEGGGVILLNSPARLDRCVLVGNHANLGGGLGNRGKSDASSKAVVTFCLIRDNTALAGGGIYARYANPMAVINCRIERNRATSDDIFLGGGGLMTDVAVVDLIGCVFCQNQSVGFGGGVKSKWYPFPRLVHCTIVGNQAANDQGGGIFVWNAPYPEMRNSIVWGNRGGNIKLGGGSGGADVKAEYSCIEGGWPGTGNISAGPNFLDAARGDLRLAADSPCVNAGNEEEVTLDAYDLNVNGNHDEPLPLDTAERVRAIGKPDMGALEFQGAPEGVLSVQTRISTSGPLVLPSLPDATWTTPQK